MTEYLTKEPMKYFDVEYHVLETQIADVVFEQRKESNPCSLCAKMRKGALNDFAKSIRCNKIAYAHHKDDMIETMFLSLIYEGRFHCFSPVTYLDKKRFFCELGSFFHCFLRFIINEEQKSSFSKLHIEGWKSYA